MICSNFCSTIKKQIINAGFIGEIRLYYQNHSLQQVRGRAPHWRK